MFLYPKEFPLEAIAKARTIITAGEWAEQKARLAKCFAEVACYALNVGLGDPDVVGSLSQEAFERLLPNNDQLAELESFAATCSEFSAANCQSAAPGDVGFDPLSLATLLATVIPMVLKWIHDRRNPQPAPEPAT